MSAHGFSSELMQQAELLASMDAKKPKQASLRRAVSTSYYALFHTLTWGCATLIAPTAERKTLSYLQRWFEHGQMYKACGVFSAPVLTGPLAKLVGSTTTAPDIVAVARSFRELQDARHSADYDMTSHWSREQARDCIELAHNGIAAWKRAAKLAQTSIFALALLDLNRVQSERK